jgi:hypothetical protein
LSLVVMDLSNCLFSILKHTDQVWVVLAWNAQFLILWGENNFVGF